MSRQPNEVRPISGGVQKLYRFANDYGASVVQHSFSYGRESGLWEMAVLRYTGPGILDFDLTYETPITNDVLGSLDDNEVEILLVQIERLPAQSGGDA